MAAIEFPEALQKRIEESGPVDQVIGVTGPADVEELRAKATAALKGIAAKTVVAYAGTAEAESADASAEGIQLAAYPMPENPVSLAFWLDVAAAQRSVLALAAAWQARACLVMHNDLAALEPAVLRLLTEPVLDGKSDLVMPQYPFGKYEGLINKSLLAPLSRALYGKRVRFPVAFDYCAGASAAARLVESGTVSGQSETPLLWPANEVAINGGRISQAAVDVHHAAQTDDLDLSQVLTELAGSLFQEAETNAACWQRVRGSQAVVCYGSAGFAKNDGEPVDARPMVESFVLGSRNLEEVWRLVMPPATMLELRRLARLDVEQFRLPDALWARIIYDFALAHRMRRMSRTHVLGAMTPLYLGWVGSYTQEVGSATVEEADRRVEQLARAFEEQKPYFVSRWRWPERAN